MANRDIKGYENLYSIDENGNIFSKINNRFLKPWKCKGTGYLYICLCKEKIQKKFTIHRLVALNFLDNPNNYPCINHKDGNKTNNNKENLEWCTYSHNMKEAFKIGIGNTWCGKKFGEQHPNYKFRGKWETQKEVLQLDKELNLIKEFNSAMEIKRELNYCPSHIGECCKNKRKTAYGYIWRYKNV